jgi:hypothetical protein
MPAGFSLSSFSERMLYRVLEIIGANRDETISDTQNVLFRGTILSIPPSTWTADQLTDHPGNRGF